MWQKIKDWFKSFDWKVVVDSEAVKYLFPLAIFFMLVAWEFWNPVRWIVFLFWALVTYRNWRE